MAESKKKILVVDDEQRITDIIERFLVRSGFLVCKAYNGHDGMKILEKESVDLIILDEKMPGMSGTTFRKEIGYKMHEMPVILLTGSIGMLNISEEQKKLFKHILIKPVRLSDLLKLIKKLLKKSLSENQ